MNKNIFESRELQGLDGNLRVSVNLDEYGKFYALGIYPVEGSSVEFDADNPEWIQNDLFPELQNWIYDGTPISEAMEAEIYALDRKDRVGLYEMLVTASALGWMKKEE